MHNNTDNNLTNDYTQGFVVYEKDMKDRDELFKKFKQYPNHEFLFKLNSHKINISTHDRFKVFNVADFKNNDGTYTKGRGIYYLEVAKVGDIEYEKLLNKKSQLKHDLNWNGIVSESEKQKILNFIIANKDALLNFDWK